MRRPKVNQNSRVEPEDQAIRSPRHSPDGYEQFHNERFIDDADANKYFSDIQELKASEKNH
jgi:hypothetical protein